MLEFFILNIFIINNKIIVRYNYFKLFNYVHELHEDMHKTSKHVVWVDEK